ncbi:hypothetical protein N7468_002836 [Penicillium chermesinum]|uniref:Zn(2)-C6 fungal-type domain-containing protein n=1 Tax=Penicillium chermesinum TaxID=63820 RepID=A0A9W9TYU1_9EURO|nr:uncharacterized protein N7468_002836 [Penicillium chermesinum]KAJ5247853.1 hypothetical protein N7468_002836 [Penicillium chermesinum]
MSDFTSLTGKFRIQKEKSTKATKTTRRHREAVACSRCRANKLRCDRQHPCRSCVQKDEAPLCSFQRALPTAKDAATAKDRLAHLESLVKELMQSEPSEDSSPGNDALADPRLPDQNPIGTLGKAAYVGSTHWCAILDDIHELKVALGRHEEPRETPDGHNA